MSGGELEPQERDFSKGPDKNQEPSRTLASGLGALPGALPGADGDDSPALSAFQSAGDQAVTVRGPAGPVVLYKSGDIVGDSYRLSGLLGMGGMGVIYRARHTILDKDFALKLLAPGAADSIQWRRFQAEGRSLAKLHHPNIVAIHNMGIDRGICPFFVMDWLPGITLADRIASGSLSLDEVVAIFLQIASGLYSAHQCGVIHRDIKPSNIMLVPTTGGTMKVVIVDFGLARLNSADKQQQLTAIGEIFGSPLYMSPEQCIGASVDHRTDIYSLGCSLFEVLAGKPPFRGETAFATAMLHQTQAPPSLAEACGRPFSSGWEVLVGRMLAKSADQRFQSVLEFAGELSKLANDNSYVQRFFPAAGADYSVGNGPAALFDDSGLAEDEDGDEEFDSSGSTFIVPRGLYIALAVLVLLGCSGIFLAFNGRQVSSSSSSSSSKISANILSQSQSLAKPGSGGREQQRDVFIPSLDVEADRVAAMPPFFKRYGPGAPGHRLRYFANPGMQSAVELDFGGDMLPEGKEFSVPENTFLRLRIGLRMLSCPQVMDKFRPTDINELRFDAIDFDPGPFLDRIGNWQALHALTLTGMTIKPGYLRSIGSLSRPYCLNLLKCTADGGRFSEAHSLSNVTALKISEMKLDPEFLQGLSRAGDLRQITLQDVILAPGTVESLSAVPDLQKLILRVSDGEAEDEYGRGYPFRKPFQPFIINELKALKHLQKVEMEQPPWLRQDILRLLREVKAARGNNWAKKFDYKVSG